MLLLAIDTATRRVGVALGGAHGLLGAVELGGPASVGPPRHAEQLAPAIEFCCAEAGVTLADVTAIAVGIGPGMFTGLRVGVTTAKALGLALAVPLVPVPSLDLIAYPLRHAAADLVVPTIDARRNELYYACYRPVPGGVQRIGDYRIATPDDLVADLAARGEDALLCGDGALRFREELDEADTCRFAGPGHSTPDLTALVELAVARVERGQVVDADVVVPMYLRQSDAELAAAERAS
jgi:tRNA threonylcarbamoyladenosine biosynthesis protein TsaB